MRKIAILILIIVVVILTGCSTTNHLPEGETLYTGIRDVKYLNRYQTVTSDKKINSDSSGVIVAIADAAAKIQSALNGATVQDINADNAKKRPRQATREEQKAYAASLQAVKDELEIVLSYPPNNSLFGSSTMRTPFPIGLWVNDATYGKTSGFSKWIRKKFGSDPVLISTVNPDTRVKLASNVLENYGYFKGTADYAVIPDSKNSKKAKLDYYIKLGRVYRLDSIEYLNFSQYDDSLLRATQKKSFLKKGEAFKLLNLTSEQTRLETLFRNQGYYYYKANMVSYKADTIQKPYRVQLRVMPSTNMNERAQKRWYIGNTNITLLRNSNDTINNSIGRKSFKMLYSGKKPALKPGVLMRNIIHRKGELYRQDDNTQTQTLLSELGLFSQLNLSYTPRDTTKECDTLDLWVNAVMDKPYNADLELNVITKSNSQFGPGLNFAVTKRNAFRGAELLRFKVFGSYEWKTNEENTDAKFLNSYELGANLSLEIPRFLIPGMNSRRIRYPNSTTINFLADWLNRSSYFNLFSLSMGLSYNWKKNETISHQFTPFNLQYDKLLHSSAAFHEIMEENPALYASMQDRFIPSMQYTMTYNSKDTHRNPLWLQLSVKEAGNITSGIYAIAGQGFNEQNKKLFNNPFAQYLKFTAEAKVNYKLTTKTRFVTRLMAGAIWSYGNSRIAPYSDQFYVGGANSIRAYTIRTIGPGHYHTTRSKYSYMDQTGDIKFEGNVEYRWPIFGALEGALFLDAGNIWLTREDENRPGGLFEISNFFSDLAVGTGLGVRYNMDFLVLRLDLGIALHNPTLEKQGFYNINKFTDGMTLHFAIGYPF